MKNIKFDEEKAKVVLCAIDSYVSCFDADDPIDSEIIDDLLDISWQLFEIIPAEDMPKITCLDQTIPPWNKKMHGRDEEGDFGKPDVWRIHPREKAA